MDNQLCFFTIFASFLVIILIEAWRRSKKSTKNLPPGPSKLPIIGNMHQFVGSLPHHRLTDLAKKHGPIMHLQLGQLSQVVISSPELAKEVTKHDLSFASRSINVTNSVLQKGGLAFAPYGDHWRQMKKICTIQLLSAKRVQSFKSIREEEVSYLIESIASNANAHAPVNLTQKLVNLSFSIISRTAFGKTRKQEEAFTPIVKDIVTLMGGFYMADFFPSIKLLEVVTGLRSKIQKLHQEADTILEEVISEHRERSKSENNEAEDLVSTLLNILESETLELPLTMQDMKAVILDIFLGGVDSSSTVLGWAMSELVKHPKILEKAQAEVRQVLDRKGKIDLANLKDLKYLNLVINETLRLHPPDPLIPRETRERVEISGYNIPEKTPVIINTWAILRDPRHWVEPEKFSPERFLNNAVDYKGTNFEYIPFGAGRRICPGMHFALSNVEVALSNLLYHFDWKIPDGGKPEDVDMTEHFGVVVRRKNDLCVIPILVNVIESKLIMPSIKENDSKMELVTSLKEAKEADK